MPYFDLHLHPGLKTLFLPQDGSQLSAWHTIEAPTFLVGDILSSQSSLEQLSRKQEVPLICLTLHPPEAGMLDQYLIIAGAILIFGKYMNPGRLSDMYNGTDGYQQVFAEEQANLFAGPRPDDNIPAGIQVKFLRNWTDYDPADTNTVHVVFNIEGGHALYDHQNQLADPQNALDNLKAFLDKGYLTLYFTPAHLTPNQFINHAYGNKMLTRGALLPQGLGITNDGKQLIDYAYSQGLLIDVKHMSLLARRQFYLIHDQYYPDKPIIASHVGFTGMSADSLLGWVRNETLMGDVVQLMSYKYPSTAGNGYYFYPLTINLFMDDLGAILRSGGLIGLSMDVRILGGKDDQNTPQYDYLSQAEYAVLSDPGRDVHISAMADALWAGAAPAPAPPAPLAEPPEFAQAIAEETADLTAPPGPADTLGPDAAVHAGLIANHLLYLFIYTQNAGLPPPWNNVCIGSDFDGLIAAVDCCKNATQYSDMAALLQQQLTAMAAAAGIGLGLDPAAIVAQFCYTNAFNFFNKHFGG